MKFCFVLRDSEGDLHFVGVGSAIVFSEKRECVALTHSGDDDAFFNVYPTADSKIGKAAVNYIAEHFSGGRDCDLRGFKPSSDS